MTLDKFVERAQSIGIGHWRDRVRAEPCCWCLSTARRRKTTIEHVIPVSQRGRQGYTNYVGACYSCNQQRGDTSIPLWLTKFRYGSNFKMGISPKEKA